MMTLFPPSRSLIRRLRHSSSRRPAPYCNNAIRRYAPCRLSDHTPHFLMGQDNWQSLGPDSSHDSFEAVQRAAENFSVQEQQCREGLVLSRGRDVPFNSKVSQEGIDLRLAHRLGMSHLVEEDESAAPVMVSVLGPPTVMAHSASVAQAVEELRLGGIWGGGRHGRFRGGLGVLGPAQFPAPAWPVYVGGSLPERGGAWGYQFSRSQLLSRTPGPSEM